MSHRLTITLSDETYNRIKDNATRNYRAIGQEINYMLDHYTEPTKPGIIYPAGVRETPVLTRFDKTTKQTGK